MSRPVMSGRSSKVTSAKASGVGNRSKESRTTVEDLEAFDASYVKRAVVGLVTYLSERERSEGQNLLDAGGEYVALTFELAKIPPGVSPKPVAIPLPHPLYHRSGASVCLITRDPQKKWKELMSSEWKRDQHNEMETPKIIGISKLKSNYSTPALKRQLLNTYDIFLCDNRVVEQMPRILGRPFIDANKIPIDVKVRESSLLPGLTERLNQTFMRLRTGTSVTVKLGRAGDPPKHLYQNAISVIRAVARYFNPSEDEIIDASPKSLFRVNEIRAIHLTATNAPSLPIHVSAAVRDAVNMIMKMKATSDTSDAASAASSDPESQSGDKSKKEVKTINKELTAAVISGVKKGKRSSAEMMIKEKPRVDAIAVSRKKRRV